VVENSDESWYDKDKKERGSVKTLKKRTPSEEEVSPVYGEETEPQQQGADTIVSDEHTKN